MVGQVDSGILVSLLRQAGIIWRVSDGNGQVARSANLTPEIEDVLRAPGVQVHDGAVYEVAIMPLEDKTAVLARRMF